MWVFDLNDKSIFVAAKVEKCRAVFQDASRTILRLYIGWLQPSRFFNIVVLSSTAVFTAV
jgi:hypothetical protein